ncbi:DNA-binding CsgD family transcriptional regulator [Aliiruegeria haliotis]|uniref:DNA-binding CsgD family transcriptional regulator n=1 Tax=Aliiruegeria haliotis TaxID=1280846 RepID=A0A2T0RZZ4_9RHOB|nr:LuxR C-terminal-related transcriptional regulator [Aliiruegeria haliotis]PRY26735.1 DNA-binding CsgD family transcriptional regulator [Aliiruegeria haliotis]
MSDNPHPKDTADLGAVLARLDAQAAHMKRIEEKIDRMMGLYNALGSIAAGVPPGLVAALHAMSPAEHVALQMVLDGRINREISVCLDVSEERVQEWVGSVIRKLEVESRAAVRDLMLPVMRIIPAAEYERASGGIPKDWNDKYGVPGVPDPYRTIYHPD